MTKRSRLVHLVLFCLVLTGLTWNLYHRPVLPVGDKAIWFHSGLLMLLVGLFWVEHFFTKPSDVVLNALTVYISVSLLDEPPHQELWLALRLYALVLMVTAFAIVWSGTPALPQFDTSPTKRAAYAVVVRLGSARV